MQLLGISEFSKLDKTRSKFLFYIIIFLGFQQFPIIRVGGSLKIYEILGFILLLFNIVHFKKVEKIDKINFWAFQFFVLVPILSYVYSSLFYEYPNGYYLRWPQANGVFKFNYYLFPLLQIAYMVMNYSTLITIIKVDWLYKNLYKLMKVAVGFGTIIALYSLFALYVFDPIALLPQSMQFKPAINIGRSSGLSQEAGTYVLYQTWITLFAWYIRKHYKNKFIFIFIFTINVASLVLTYSTALWGLMLAIIASIFFFEGKANKKTQSVILFCLLLIIGYALIYVFQLQNLIEIMFVKKIQNATTVSHKTIDSGSSRKYFSNLGFRIFFDHLFLGSGYGRSLYYMWEYEYKVGISVFVERLTPTAVPLSMFSIIPAETGILGSVAFILFYFFVFKKLWQNKNKGPFHKMFLIGAIVELVAFTSLYTPHAVFLWAYLGLGLGYIRYYDKVQSERTYINE